MSNAFSSTFLLQMEYVVDCDKEDLSMFWPRHGVMKEGFMFCLHVFDSAEMTLEVVHKASGIPKQCSQKYNTIELLSFDDN